MLRSSWQEFATASVPPPQRMRRWSELGSNTLSELHVSPDGAEPFEARLQRVEIGRLGLVFIDTSAAIARSTASRIGAWASPEGDAMVLTVAERGKCCVSQGAWAAALDEGDIVVRDLTKPWVSEAKGRSGLILVKMPYSTILKKVANPESIVGRPLSCQKSQVALASNIIRATKSALLQDPDGDWHGLLSDIVTDVFRLICESNRPPAAQLARCAAGNSVRRDAIGYIMRHLDDPALSVASVAAGVGVTVRQVQRAFLELGHAPRNYILNQRLDRAAETISMNNERKGGLITDVAFANGFNDVSHFSRSFARRFGCAPRNYRGTPPIAP